MNRLQAGLAAAVTAFAIAPLQEPKPRKLGAPVVSLDQEFTGIDGVRELRDGRVIVLDARDRAIHVIDLTTKSGTKIGRDGDGPGEFRLPRSLVPLGGDTTLVNDMARFDKLLVITPAGEVGGFVSIQDKPGTRPFVVGGADAAGRFYENNYSGDSNSIVRWDRARARRDTVAHISMKVVSPLRRPSPESGSAPRGAARGGGPPPPYFTVSQWDVSVDGHLAIVTPEPYRVTIVSPTGARIQGATIPVVPVRVGDAEKEQYRIERQRPVAAMTMSAGGAITTSFQKPRYTEPDEWPATLPPFLPNAVSYASDGMLWVRRSTRAGAPALYDVFDATAKRAFQVELPPNTNLVGFGASSVYLARVDNDDLHYLQQYKLPK